MNNVYTASSSAGRAIDLVVLRTSEQSVSNDAARDSRGLKLKRFAEVGGYPYLVSSSIPSLASRSEAARDLLVLAHSFFPSFDQRREDRKDSS